MTQKAWTTLLSTRTLLLIIKSKKKKIAEQEKAGKKRKTTKTKKGSKKIVDIEAEQKERFIVKYLLPDGQTKETEPRAFNLLLQKLDVILSVKYITLNLLERIQTNIEFINFKSKIGETEGSESKLSLFDIYNCPHLFLNENIQLIPLRVYENIIEKFDLFQDEKVMDNLCIAFLYSTFLYDEKFYYLRRFKYQKKGSNEFNKLNSYKVKMIQNGANWVIYDCLEAKYKEYKSKWHSVPEWESFKDKFLVEAYNKDIQDSKMAKYWTTQKFIDFHDALNDRVLDLEESYELTEEDKYQINYLIEKHETISIYLSKGKKRGDLPFLQK